MTRFLRRLPRLRVRGRSSARRLGAAVVLGLLAAGSLIAGAVVGGDGPAPERVPEVSAGRPVDRVSYLARIVPPAAEEEAPTSVKVPRTVAELAERLPLDRKVAQLFLVGFEGTDLTADVFSQLRRLDWGGIVIDRANYTDVGLLGQLAGEARVIAGQEGHVPPWVMAPQEGGEFSAFPDLPPASAPADIPTAADAAAEALRSARSLGPLGFSGVLAPVVDVGLVDEPALGARIYSDDPQEVADYAAATVEAYRRERVFSAAKHFPGLGTSSQPTEEGPATVGLSLEELRERDLVPFRAAIGAGVPGVVLSHASYAVDDFIVPGSLSKRIVTGLLRRGMKFAGVAITDDLADPAITAVSSVPDAAVRAVEAGADMLQLSGPASDQQAAYVAVLRAVQRGEIARERLNQAVLRVLNAKRDYGLIR